MQNESDGTLSIEIDSENGFHELPAEMVDRYMPRDPVFRRVAEEVVYMRLKTVGAAVKSAMGERDPKDIVDKGLTAGMALVAKLYADQVYRLPEMMMAAKTMEIGIAMTEEASGSPRPRHPLKDAGPHDIGRGIGDLLMKANGFDEEGQVPGMPVMVEAVSRYIEARPHTVPGTSLMVSQMKPFPDSRFRR